MTFFDYFIILTLSLSAIISLFRGFFKEVISLATWLAAVWAAFTFSSLLAPKIVPYIPFINDLPLAKSVIVQALISGAIIFFAVLLMGALINYLFSLAVRKTGLSGSDRLLGMLFGAARGGVIVALVTLFIGKNELVQQESWWINSQLKPHAQNAADLLQRMVPDKYKHYLPGDQGSSYIEVVPQETQSSDIPQAGQEIENNPQTPQPEGI
jgi:membrane protein required for colicin V production